MTNNQPGYNEWPDSAPNAGGSTGHGGSQASGGSGGSAARRGPFAPTPFPHSESGSAQADGEP